LIGSLSAHIVRFLTQRKGFFVLLVLSITGFLIYGTSILRIEKDLYAVLPNGREHARFNEVIQKNNLNKQVIFSLEIDGDEESCISIAEQLVEKLQVQFHGKLENIQLYQEVNEQVLLTHLQAASILLPCHRFLCAASATRRVCSSIKTKLARSAACLKHVQAPPR
jgi:hypothetical protein